MAFSEATRMSRRECIRRAALVTAGARLVGGVAACDRRPGVRYNTQAGQRNNGILKIGIARPRGVVDPLTSRSRSEGFVLKPVLPPLGRILEDGSLAPGLVKTWSADQAAKVWTFEFRSAKWQNGQPFTAHDVAATLDILLNPAGPSPTVSGYRGILSHGSYEVRDDLSMDFHLDRAYVDFPYIIFHGATAWFPKGYVHGDFAKGGVGGTGPFLLKTYAADRGAVYVKNPDYWDARNILVDGLDIAFFDDDQSMSLALQSGEIDALPVLSSSAVLALADNPDFRILSARTSAYNSLRMHVDAVPFKDRRVRQALAYAIDRNAIIKTIYGGSADIGNDHVFAPAFPQSASVVAALPQRERDVERARKLLADAGYANGLKLTLVSEQYGDMPQYLQLVQSQAKAVGFDISLNLTSQSQYYGGEVSQHWLDTPFGATDFGERATPGAMIAPTYLTGAPFNESHYSNPQFDASAKAFDAEADPVKRARLAIAAATILHDDVPTIIAYFGHTRRPTSSRVRNFPAGPASQLDLTGTWISPA